MEKLSYRDLLRKPNLILKPKKLFGVLKEQAVNSGVPEKNFHLVDANLSEISFRSPYIDSTEITTVFDLDGALLNQFTENVSPIIKRSIKCIIWSARFIEIAPDIKWLPFISRALISDLRKIFNSLNFDCHLEFHTGLAKILKPNNFITDELQTGRPTAVIGSSCIDRIGIAKAIETAKSAGANLTNLFYFDTGNRVI